LEVLAGELDKLLPVTKLKGPATIPVRDILKGMTKFLKEFSNPFVELSSRPCE
jgi:hypothetical protein